MAPGSQTTSTTTTVTSTVTSTTTTTTSTVRLTGRVPGFRCPKKGVVHQAMGVYEWQILSQNGSKWLVYTGKSQSKIRTMMMMMMMMMMIYGYPDDFMESSRYIATIWQSRVLGYPGHPFRGFGWLLGSDKFDRCPCFWGPHLPTYWDDCHICHAKSNSHWTICFSGKTWWILWSTSKFWGEHEIVWRTIHPGAGLPVKMAYPFGVFLIFLQGSSWRFILRLENESVLTNVITLMWAIRFIRFIRLIGFEIGGYQPIWFIGDHELRHSWRILKVCSYSPTTNHRISWGLMDGYAMPSWWARSPSNWNKSLFSMIPMELFYMFHYHVYTQHINDVNDYNHKILPLDLDISIHQ